MRRTDLTDGLHAVERIKEGYRTVVTSPKFIEFTSNRLNLFALSVLALLVFCAVFAEPITVGGHTLQPFSLTPYDPLNQNIAERLHPPSTKYPLGTDPLGRDVLSRLLVGARISLQISIIVVAISVTIGTAVGVIAGYFGGWIDEALMRFVDIILAFPGIILAIVIAGILGPSLGNIMIALAAVGWTQYARVIRGSVLSVKEQEFVTASKLVGTSTPRVIIRHVIPNVISPVVVLATMDMATVVLATAGLSFLGLGAQPPTPEWGTMLSDGRSYLRHAWWIVNFPGLAIMVTVLGFNILGDSLRDLLDPRETGDVQQKGGL